MVSFILVLFASLFFQGIILRTKSMASGRKGPGILQPVRDILKLFKKGSVYSETSTIIFRIAPSIYFSSVLLAIMILPLGHSRGIISFPGDFILFALVLATGKFLMILSALDTGSSFEGMGASREALFSMLAEPAFFILMGALGLLTGFSSFHQIFLALHFGSPVSYALGVIAMFVLTMICMVENSRMPVDDPKTHLELTMIHEVMILDNSGFDLGLIQQTTGLKFAMYGSLVANLFLGDWPLYLTIPMFIGIQMLFAVLVGILESFSARFRMSHNAQFILVLSSLSLLLVLGALMMMGKFS
jgi:formate hydrogenlyase subunit 4